MLLKPFLFLLLSNSIQCSVVLDATNQHGIHISDYCPKMKHCPEGAHIMCMYYDPNRVMGPRCRNARNVSMTPDLANKLLDVSNAVRSRISRGKEKGKDGKNFPKGYGIFRLKWDNELATFAQVLANQCVLRHDFCRATKRFPDPGQTAGLVRFSVPDWIPVSKSRNFSRTGLDDEKLLYAIMQTLKSWYAQKGSVTSHMLTSYPDWTEDPNQQNGRLYLEMIYGPATHMGCGMSAYTEYAFYDNDAALNYNSIQVICNYSARPRTGMAVYNTVPPSDRASPFNSCGCPAGSMGDDDCLCLEIDGETGKSQNQLENKKCHAGVNCDPTVVLLPIFTVEDAPPEKLITQDRLTNASVKRALGQAEIIDSFEELFNNSIPENRKSRNNIANNLTTGTNGQRERPTVKRTKNAMVKVRHFGKNTDEIKHYEEPQIRNENMHSRKQMQRHMKTSFFAKTPRFELPGSRNFSIKRNVVPRKDFSEAKKLVGKYLYEKNREILPIKVNKLSQKLPALNDVKSVETVSLKNNLNNNLQPKLHEKKKIHLDDVHFHDILTTETILNTAEQRIINENKYFNDLYPLNDHNELEANTVTEDSDKKFMALLDTLEQEVKHVELRDNEKRIFDAKIKKIYGTVVGKSSYALTNTDKAIDVENKPENGAGQSFKKGENKQRFANRYKKRYNKIENDNFTPKLEQRSNKLENNNSSIELPNSQREQNDEFDVGEKFLRQNSYDFATNDVKKITTNAANPAVAYNRRDRPNIRRNMNNVREINHNQINSYDRVQYRYDNKYNGIKTYRNENFVRDVIRNNEEPIYRSSRIDYRRRNKNYYGTDEYQDPLSVERRRYYQAKLDSMERKLKETKRSNRRKNVERPRQMRTLRNNIGSDHQMNSIYTSGRARFLHGY